MARRVARSLLPAGRVLRAGGFVVQSASFPFGFEDVLDLPPSPARLRLRAAARLRQVLERVWSLPASAWRYPHRLALEAAVQDPVAGLAAGEVAARLTAAGCRASGPFNALCFRLYLATGDPAWRDEFVALAQRPWQRAVVSPEGAWLHPRGRHGPGHAVLIDSFQEEASRVAKLAWLLRTGRWAGGAAAADELEAAAVGQFRVHREVLRDPVSGLWRNGRGWIEGQPGALAPGCWSRGHGWLLRGLVESLEHLAAGHGRAELRGLFEEVSAALLRVQGVDGRWQAVLDAPPGASPPETSGSAMIAAAWLQATVRGDLPVEPFRSAALRAATTVLEHCVTDDGTVLGACRGPGPLAALEGYAGAVEFPRDEPHGQAAVTLLAAALAQA